MRKIHYNLRSENGEHEILTHVSIPYSETNLDIAKREAYKGEYTVEDDGQPEPDTATTDDIINAMLGVK